MYMCYVNFSFHIYVCLCIFGSINIFFLPLQAGVILVSHDERLIQMVCTELWVCGEGSVRCIEEGFDEYRRIIEKELEL